MEGTPQRVFDRYAALYENAQRSDFGEFDRNIVVLDTETTGVSLNHDELTQIAAARMDNGKVVDWYITFVNPGKPIPDEIAHLTNIHDEDVASAPAPAEALAKLVDFVGDAKIVAHNADFDRNFTTKHPAGYPLLENMWIDSLSLSRIALPRMKSHRLIDLVKAFGAPLSTHRADDDVAATCALYRILLAAVESMPDELVLEIARMATPQEWSTVSVFTYFADKIIERGQNAMEDAAAEFHIPTFSLRKLRRNAVSGSDFRPKKDAKSLVEDVNAGLSFPTAQEIDHAFSEQGVMGRIYSEYEPRIEQRQMSRAISASFSTSDNILIEAGTGVGKSMAYLIPSALTALKNGIAVGVATKTNALLDQLVYKELPALAAALEESGNQGENEGETLTFAALKGFSHYPCLRKIDRLVADGPQFKTIGNDNVHQAPSLAALLSYVEQTEFDDIDGLKIDYRALPRYSIATTSHDCLRRKCPYFGTSCFVHGSRRRAEAAHIVVTNHSLMFCDLAADGGLLPPIRFWVVDEAHGAETEARRAFSLELSADDINALARKVSEGETTRNVFVRAERNVVASNFESGETLFYGLTNKAKAAGKDFAEKAQEFTAHIQDLLYFDTNKRSKGYEFVDLWLNDEIRRSSCFQGLAEFGEAMRERAEKLVTACQELVAYLDDIEGAAVSQREIASVALELKDIVKACEVILFSDSESYVYAAHLQKKTDRRGSRLEAMPYNVGVTMNDTLYESTYSVAFASATLAIDGSFGPFENAMGLNWGENSHCNTLALDSSYDYDNQMTVLVAKDMPEPNEPRYLAELQRLLTGVHLAQNGSALTLFTNRKEMEQCFDVVKPELKAHDLRLVCQKWGVSVKGLRDDFIADEHLSLFALKSFWEGFDAPGATLKAVIIPKLPFSKPTDPLSSERAARDDQAWRRYVLPAAILETKQAAGRLIRKADDRGLLILADKRLVSKGYGKSFLRSLPSKNVQVLTIDEIIERVKASVSS